MNYYMTFANLACIALYKMELEGQISDGKYENMRPYDHWKWVCKDYEYRIGDVLGGHYPWNRSYTHYNLREWLGYMKKSETDSRYEWSWRILYYAAFASCLKTDELDIFVSECSKLSTLIEYLMYYNRSHSVFTIDEFKNNVAANHTYLSEYAEACSLWNDNNINTCIAKINSGEYSIKQLREDLKLMGKTVNTLI